ncbi:alpha/beta hydrolase [Paracoccus pacificus]|uniref:Alpha/beta hydrolase n=1 Tax=Paracoccus pacificus TaxID=1463598 RepID=A0ABW4R505_9RHOB
MARFMDTTQGRRIAFDAVAGKGPGVVFLGGFKSDMQGSKALDLADWARAEGRAFLRFDYSGHGKSGGRFEDGAIGDWYQDALAVIAAQTQGPQVLVGSSMGGWISLLIARHAPERVAGLVTIAAAPDFTEQGFWAEMNADERAALMRDGQVIRPSEYDPAGYPITRRLIEDGRNHLVLQKPLHLPFPVRMLQGTQDADVPVDWAMALLSHVTGDDVRLTLVIGADHRFSTPACLTLIRQTVAELVGAVR